MKVPKGVATRITTARAVLRGTKTFIQNPRASVRSWYGGISASVVDLNLLRARDFASWVLVLPSIALDITSAVLLFTQQKEDSTVAEFPLAIANASAHTASSRAGLPGVVGNWTYGSPLTKEREMTSRTGEKVVFWSGVAINLIMTMDYFLRLYDPRYSFIDRISEMAMNFAKRQMFTGTSPMPTAALLSRYGMYLTMFVIRTAVKIGLPEDHPAVLFFSFMPFFNLSAAWSIHFCIGYLPFAFLLKCGLCDMPTQCSGVRVKFTCCGPTVAPAAGIPNNLGTRDSVRGEGPALPQQLATELGPAMVGGQAMSGLVVAVAHLDLDALDFEIEPPEDLLGVIQGLGM